MKNTLASIAFILLNSFILHSQPLTKKAPGDFKVVGYYLLNSLLRDTISNDSNYTFLDKVTHVNLAFINPDTAGNFKQDLPLNQFISRAHRKNVKVLASIAGGGPHTYYAALLQGDKRKTLVTNLVSLTTIYELDGIDVDLEGNDIDANYEAFVTDLAAALKTERKLITAAIATAYKDKLSDKAIQQFDFVNVMSYDRTGPWNPKRQGQHSPYSMAEEDLEYWNKTRLVPKEKLVLGVPFYGYGFGLADAPVVSMTYKDIVAAYPTAASADTLILPDHKIMYYNGSSTIKKKTELATNKASGVMIWQLLGDTPGEASLLNLIYNITRKD
ncbi:MAG TPA: glycosyl hydrolase family 18 protein [Segetibacter sp.]